MPRIKMVFWEYMFHEFYFLIFIRPVPHPPLIFIFYFSYFFFILRKNHWKKKYHFNCALLHVGQQILDILDQRNEARSHIGHLGWRPFNVLGYRHTKEFWAYVGDNIIFKWKLYIPVPDFPLDGLGHRKYFLIASEKLLF